MSDNLQFFVGYTLVDITPTHVTRSSEQDSIERNQQRNWETVLQCISLRAQPILIQEPELAVIQSDSVLHQVFGDFYTGEQKVWTWNWAVEHSDVYDTADTPLGALQKDFEQVPIVTYLTETARFMLPIFYPYGSIKNVYFTPAQKY